MAEDDLRELNFLPCPCCREGRMLIKDSQIALLEKNFSEEQHFQCLKCEQVFESIEDSLDHGSCFPDKNLTEDFPFSYHCLICENAFENKKQYSEHACYEKKQKLWQKRKKRNEPPICPLCQKSSSSNSNLRRHFTSCMVLFVCKICDKKYPNEHAVKIHYRLHTGESPYPCSICGRAFASSQLLWSHQKFSHTEKSYQCDSCSDFFATRQMLGNHIRTKHTKERPLLCQECGETFSNTSVFYQHKAKHSDVRKHGCPNCSMRFKRISSLRRHELIHSNTLPHSCLICEKKFRQRGDLKKHTNLMHPGLED